ncbi:MAG: YbfB/YjiJ family MFS transporter [Candidatus Competibacteraceae bacterium]|jgi:MFS family permease|nr:YbfB/YjiJ family MFS transporter [Candidatus Competibacteraceae bacterium]
MKTNNTSAPPTPFHYGWIIVLTGILTVFIALGLGRFALGMLLPAMAETLALNYAQMGFISTGNFIGYLAAVLLSGFGAIHYGARAIIAVALLLLGLSLLAVSQAESFTAVLLLYFLTGLGSGAANVPVMGLVSHWFAPRWRGKAAGLIVTGNGLAIMFTGLLIPQVNQWIGAEGWRTSWLLFGLIGIAGAFVSLIGLRNSPQSLGLEPIGVQTSTGSQVPSPSSEVKTERGIVVHLGSIYFLFGFTYVIYITFIVTTWVQERGIAETTAGTLWFWLGFLSLFSGPLFGSLSDHLGRKAGLIIVFALQGIAYVLVAATLPDFFLYLSFGLFGLCAWSIPSIMAAAAGDYMGPQRAVAAFGAVTFFFGIGQIAGPAVAGMMAEANNSFSSSYWLAAALAATAILLTAALRKPVEVVSKE